MRRGGSNLVPGLHLRDDFPYPRQEHPASRGAGIGWSHQPSGFSSITPGMLSFKRSVITAFAKAFLLSRDGRNVLRTRSVAITPTGAKRYAGGRNATGSADQFQLAAMQSFLNVVGHWVAGILHGKEVFVSQEEAEKRAEICASCDLNVNIAGSCGACADRIARALAVIGSRRTKLDEKLGACSICSCALRAAVHVPIRASDRGSFRGTQRRFPQGFFLLLEG